MRASERAYLCLGGGLAYPGKVLLQRRLPLFPREGAMNAHCAWKDGLRLCCLRLQNEWRKFVSPTCPGPRSAHAVVASPAGGGKLYLFGEFSVLKRSWG